jgi:squalene synthase HpnC
MPKNQLLPLPLPVDHYENFPVASWLLPRPLREPVEAIYHFARGADDIADEGDLSPAARLHALDRYVRALDEIEAGVPQAERPFARLAAAVKSHALPIPLLRDLLDAFRQDVTVKRYATFAHVMDYSRRSANPIGRLLLHLFTPRTLGDRPPVAPDATGGLSPKVRMSDQICSGLQITNFWQDVAVDWKKGRVYIPQEDLHRFHVEERDIGAGNADARWERLMAFQCDRARQMLREGAPLGRMLPGRLGLEIRATVNGGLAILDKIDAVRGDVFRHRPVLAKRDWAFILLRSL